MTKTEALKIANHLVGNVHVVAANPSSKTWGYNYACGERQITTAQRATYSEARTARREHRDELAQELLDGEAPPWATLEFKW